MEDSFLSPSTCPQTVICNSIKKTSMFVNIKKYEHKELDELFKDFLSKGGGLHFHPFVIEKNYRDEIPEKAYQRHLLVARQTLEQINYQSNFHNNKQIGSINHGIPHLATTNHELLNSSGKQINLTISLAISLMLKLKPHLLEDERIMQINILNILLRKPRKT